MMKALIASESFFSSIDTAYLDCVADNLALLLLHTGIRNVRAPLACQWYFAFDEAQRECIPALSRYALAEIIEKQTGCRLLQSTLDTSNYIDVLSQSIERSQPALVFGDTFFIPWLPYFGHEHQEHSFIIDGISDDKRLVHIVDAHENTTEWGRANPIACDLPASALRVIFDTEYEHAKTIMYVERVGEVPEVNVQAILLENAQYMASTHQQEQMHAFINYYHTHQQDIDRVKKFGLALWLIRRTRMLHGLWLRDIARQQPELLPDAYPDLYEQTVALPWQRASEQAYLLIRRVSRGRPAPEACFSMIEQTLIPQEAALAESLFHHLYRRL